MDVLPLIAENAMDGNRLASMDARTGDRRKPFFAIEPRASEGRKPERRSAEVRRGVSFRAECRAASWLASFTPSDLPTGM